MLTNEISEIVGSRIREVRDKQGISGPALARRCKDLGMPHLSAATISNIETGRRGEDGRRRRDVTVDELLTLAVALDVAPIHLVIPPDSQEPFPVAPATRVDPAAARRWLRGEEALSGERFYYSEVPADEWQRPTRAPGMADLVARVKSQAADRDPEQEVDDGQS